MENSKFILENTKHWISNCDSKVSYLLTVNGIILTIIFTSENSKYLAETLNYNPTKNILSFTSIINFLEFSALGAFLFYIIKSLYFGLRSLQGRINPDIFSSEISLNDSKIFWGTISKKNPTDYFNEIDLVTEEEFKKDLRNQVYINSKICDLKFGYYNKMLKSSSIAYILLVIYTVIKIKNIC